MLLDTRLRTLPFPPPPPCLSSLNSSSNLFLSLNNSRISLHSSNGSSRSFSCAQASKKTFDTDKAEELERADFAKRLKLKIEALGINSDSYSISALGSAPRGSTFFCQHINETPVLSSSGWLINFLIQRPIFDPGKPLIQRLSSKAPICIRFITCPKCKGGRTIHRSLSFHISKNWSYAMWRCFQVECGWAGKVFADTKNNYSSRQLTVESLKLESLGDELLAYFAERMISKETLQRNNVMQVAGDQKIIAFTYRRNGLLVGCKYRTLEKRFWQGRNTEKMLYGLDDIADADEIIIVEGELDKLSMEEAGFYNCVSVPGGAPQTVSVKELPSLDKDTSYQYLWHCKDYLDKASRIILATDCDIPGQALAEELARRLGRERCWQVRWPKKDELSSFKDANEVLKNLGANALRDAIKKAELYQNAEFKLVTRQEEVQTI